MSLLLLLSQQSGAVDDVTVAVGGVLHAYAQGGLTASAGKPLSGQSAITVSAKTDAFVMADDATSDHTAKDHRYFAALAGLTCGTPSAGVGFTIYATSMHRLQGTYQVRWV